MSKRNLVAVFMLLGTLTIFSCQRDPVVDNPDCANNTGWLRNGHELVYVSSPIYIFADTLYTSISEVSPGVFKSSSKFDDGTMFPTSSVYVQACNNSIYQAAAQDLAGKQEIYRIDGNVGDTWTATVTSSGGNTITTLTTISQKNVSVTVPAGTFVCTKFRQVSTSSAGGSVTTDSYLNNVAGLVLADGTSVHYELARKNW